MNDETELTEWKAGEKQDPDYVLAVKESDLKAAPRTPPPKPKSDTTKIYEGGSDASVIILVIVIACLIALFLVAEFAR